MSKRTLQDMLVRSDAFIVTSSSTVLPEFGVYDLYTYAVVTKVTLCAQAVTFNFHLVAV